MATPRVLYEAGHDLFGDFYDARKPKDYAIGIGINLYMLRQISPKTGTFRARIRVQMKWKVPGIAEALRHWTAEQQENNDVPQGKEARDGSSEWSARTLIFNTKEEMEEVMDGYYLTEEDYGLRDGTMHKKKLIDLQFPQVSTNAIESDIEEWYCYLKNFTNEDEDMVTLQFVENGTYTMLDPDASQFPFDLQFADFKFSLWATGRFKHRFFQLLENPDDIHYERMIRADIPLHDWTLYKPFITLRIEGVDNPAASVVISPMLRRKATFYYKHILFRLTIVSSLSLGVFTAPINLMVTRTAIVLTLLLTVVTFSFTVQEDIPRLRKYSWMDIFVLGHFLLLGGLAADVFAISFLLKQPGSDQAALQFIDNNIGIYFGSFWLFYNLVVAFAFFWYWLMQSRWRHREVPKLYPDDRKLVKAAVEHLKSGKEGPLAYDMRPLNIGV